MWCSPRQSQTSLSRFFFQLLRARKRCLQDLLERARHLEPALNALASIMLGFTLLAIALAALVMKRVRGTAAATPAGASTALISLSN